MTKKQKLMGGAAAVTRAVGESVGRKLPSQGKFKKVLRSLGTQTPAAVAYGLGGSKAALAYKALKYGYRGYKIYRAWRGGRKKFITRGHYTGRFKRPTRKSARTIFDKYNKTGCVLTTETIGNVQDTDCCYIINEVMNSRDVIRYIVSAFMRRLFEKAGFRVEGGDRAVLDIGLGIFNDAKYHITLYRLNKSTGAVSSDDYSVGTLDKFDDIVDFFVPFFENYSSGFGLNDDNNTNELHKMSFWYDNGTVGTVPLVLSMLLFSETFIQMFGYTELKVQNRTKAAGGSEDAENINNNPLQGWSYLFNGVPKAKGNSLIQGGDFTYLNFERLPYPKGVQTFGGSDPAQTFNIREPPIPKQFWNCAKAKRIRLEPGEIKKMVASKYKQGNILRILKAIRLSRDGLYQYSTYSIFPVQMIAMEDVINGSVEEEISVQYEIERKLGVKCYNKEKKFYTTDFQTRS